VRAVGDGPVLAEPLKDQTVVSPAAAKFAAVIRGGEPRAELRWFKAGKPISVDGVKYSAGYEGDEATLTVDRCEAPDAGEFSLTATNKVGSVSSKATLTVHGTVRNHFLVQTCIHGHTMRKLRGDTGTSPQNLECGTLIQIVPPDFVTIPLRIPQNMPFPTKNYNFPPAGGIPLDLDLVIAVILQMW